MASEDKALKMDMWQEFWNKNDIGWHNANVNPYLQQAYQMITRGKTNLRFLLPLCGKSVDLKWLYEQGHTVVGVEGVVNAVEEFWNEIGLPHQVRDIPEFDGKVYTSEDGRLVLYVCNFFHFNKSVQLEEKFDCIWDRGSLVAIDPDARLTYREQILTLLKPDGCYAVETLDFATPTTTGPPFHITNEILQDLYDETCLVKEVPLEKSAFQMATKSGCFRVYLLSVI